MELLINSAAKYIISLLVSLHPVPNTIQQIVPWLQSVSLLKIHVCVFLYKITFSLIRFDPNLMENYNWLEQIGGNRRKTLF